MYSACDEVASLSCFRGTTVYFWNETWDLGRRVTALLADHPLIGGTHCNSPWLLGVGILSPCSLGEFIIDLTHADDIAVLASLFELIAYSNLWRSLVARRAWRATVARLKCLWQGISRLLPRTTPCLWGAT